MTDPSLPLLATSSFQDGGVGVSGEGWEDGEGDPCPLCGSSYSSDEFWIACDFCDTWYCGKCAKMTEAKAQRVKKWRCVNCEDG